MLDEMVTLHEMLHEIVGRGEEIWPPGLAKEEEMATVKFLWMSRGRAADLPLSFSFLLLLGVLLIIRIQLVATKRLGIFCGFNNKMCKDPIVCVVHYAT